MNRKLGTVIIINVLNLMDLVVTLIGTQLTHINFLRVEQNVHFVNAYSKFLEGDCILMIIVLIYKILVGVLIAVVWLYFERSWMFALTFGILFSIYSVVIFGWTLVIFQTQSMNQLTIDSMLILLFILSFGIYYSPEELKHIKKQKK